MKIVIYENMERLLDIIVLVAIGAAFVVLLMKKWGVTEWMQVHGDDLISRMASCDFCLSFWVGTLLCCIAACVYDDPWLVFCGMFTSPLTRLMV